MLHDSGGRKWKLEPAIQKAGTVSNLDPSEIHVDHIHKNIKKWNSAGTFRLLLTLKKA